MAAGLTLLPENFTSFVQAFESVLSHVSPHVFESVLFTDGDLKDDEFLIQTARTIAAAGPWGQGFAEPLFEGEFAVISHRLLKEKHIKLTLQHPNFNQHGAWLEAIAFNVDIAPWVNKTVNQVKLAYTLDINHFNGKQTLQLMVKQLEVMT